MSRGLGDVYKRQGRAYYERMVGAVMTNQYFTAPAVEAAKKLQILLWDRGYIDEMLDE